MPPGESNRLKAEVSKLLSAQPGLLAARARGTVAPQFRRRTHRECKRGRADLGQHFPFTHRNPPRKPLDPPNWPHSDSSKLKRFCG
jgi:hypothetical protein